MKILITGADGFIGQHLVQKLSHYELCILESDLRNHEDVNKELIKYKPDMVIHLAARTEVQKSFFEQITFSDINYTGTINLIESMVQLPKIPKLLFASTMEVFGWQPVSDLIQDEKIPVSLPIFNKDTIPNPNAPYAVAKLGCEKYIEYLNRSYGLEYVNFRQTNTYGRKDNDFFVTEQIITQMIDNKKEIFLGHRFPYRNYLYIDDLIEAWLSVINDFDKAKNNTITIGPNNAISVDQHVKNIAKKLDWNGKVNWNSKVNRPGEIWLLNSDNELFQYTGWEPKVSYDEGIDRTIEFWK
jgi:nucleoside-diphosphate-sugar epimerase